MMRRAAGIPGMTGDGGEAMMPGLPAGLPVRRVREKGKRRSDGDGHITDSQKV